MKVTKYLYGLVGMLLFAACSDDYSLPLPDDNPSIAPEVPEQVAPIVILDEAFNDRSAYLTPSGAVLPEDFSDGYFERVVSERTVKVYLNACKLEADASSIEVEGESTSRGRLILDGETGAIETDALGKVTSLSLSLSAVQDKAQAVLWIKAQNGTWEEYWRTPVLSLGQTFRLKTEKPVMKYPVSLKITSVAAPIAVYDLDVEGIPEVNESASPESGMVLFEEGFYNHEEKTFKKADGSPFDGGKWTTDGYFERVVDGETLRAKLYQCRIDYTEDRISIYGENTSKGRLQIGTGGGYMEFPVLGSITKLSLALSAGTEGVPTRALVQVRDKGTSVWRDLLMSPDITTDSPLRWELEDVSTNPAAIRIMQDPAITKGNALAVYDLVLEGSLDLSAEEAYDVTLMDERFRDLNEYVDAETGAAPERNKKYAQLYFDNIVEGRTLRGNIFNGALYTTFKVADLNEPNGATDGRLLFSEDGVLESPIYGSIKKIDVKVAAADPDKPNKAIVQIKKVGEAEWTEYAVTDELGNDPVLAWVLEDISEEPCAFRIVAHPDYAGNNLAIYNIRVEGKLY